MSRANRSFNFVAKNAGSNPYMVSWSNYDYATFFNDPNWAVSIAKGTSAAHPYTRKGGWYYPHTIEGAAYEKLQSGYKVYSGSATYGVTDPSSTFAITPSDSNIQDLALSRLKNKLRCHTKEYEGAVPLVELRELRSLVKGSAQLTTQMLQTLIHIKRSRFNRRDIHKFASDAWLTFGFGIRPLISDTQAVTESINAYLNRADHFVRLTGTAEKEWFSNYTLNSAWGGWVTRSSCNMKVRCRHTLSYRYTAGIFLDVKSSNNYGVADHFGLELGSLPSIGWELLPYSWVVDYFTNTGAYLEDRFASPSGDTRYLTLSKKYQCDFLVGCTPSMTVPGFLDYHSRGGRGQRFQFDRTVLTSMPHIGWHLKSVDRVASNWVNKTLNLAALLRPH